MNNAHLYTLVTRLEQAERTRLFSQQVRPKKSFLHSAIAIIEPWLLWYQRLTTNKPITATQTVVEFGAASWRPAGEGGVEQPLRAE